MTRLLLHRDRSPETSEEPVWISFSDFMTALVTVFMLAAVALVFSLSQEQDALAKARDDADAAQADLQQQRDHFDTQLLGIGQGEQIRAEMVTEIRDQLAARGIEVEVDSTGSVLRIPVNLLGFDSGSSEIRPEHQQNALTIGNVIETSLAKDNRYALLDTVFVEGHTDGVPETGLYGGNWGLSTNRAIALWRLWSDASPNLAGLIGHTAERLFSVSGYADTRPVNADQSTEAAKAANRRIDIRFTEHRFSEEEINQYLASATPGAGG